MPEPIILVEEWELSPRIREPGGEWVPLIPDPLPDNYVMYADATPEQREESDLELMDIEAEDDLYDETDENDAIWRFMRGDELAHMGGHQYLRDQDGHHRKTAGHHIRAWLVLARGHQPGPSGRRNPRHPGAADLGTARHPRRDTRATIRPRTGAAANETDSRTQTEQQNQHPPARHKQLKSVVLGYDRCG